MRGCVRAHCTPTSLLCENELFHCNIIIMIATRTPTVHHVVLCEEELRALYRRWHRKTDGWYHCNERVKWAEEGGSGGRGRPAQCSESSPQPAPGTRRRHESCPCRTSLLLAARTEPALRLFDVTNAGARATQSAILATLPPPPTPTPQPSFTTHPHAHPSQIPHSIPSCLRKKS